MKDYLLDIIKNTHAIGKIPLVKIVGTENETKLTAIADERLFVVDGRFHNVIPEFIGRFGLPNLNRLAVTLNTEEYRENAQISMIKDQNEPTSIHFENKNGDFKNDYRTMNSSVVDSLLPDVTFTGATWHVEISPSVQSIQRMKAQSVINSEETLFYVKTDNSGNLIFNFGDPASLTGQFIFATGVKGQLRAERAWPAACVLSILSLSGDKTMKFSSDGVAMITVDSGLAVYNYILLAQQK